jgi:HTH-type transcriptional regulator, glycine betaine synthesis regulator
MIQKAFSIAMRTEFPVAEHPPVSRHVEPLSPLEVEAIDLFISFVRIFGLPKSIGEIYGLLFVAPRPLPMETMMDRLSMSKGAASQGLKLLRSFGAVKTAYVAGDRRDHYVADFELSRFATMFIKEELQPHLDSGLLRLERMEHLLEELPDADKKATASRMAKLRHWQEKGQTMLPLIAKFLVS